MRLRRLYLSFMCLISTARAVGASTAGRALNERLRQLVAQVQAELKPESDALQAEVNTHHIFDGIFFSTILLFKLVFFTIKFFVKKLRLLTFFLNHAIQSRGSGGFKRFVK